MKLKFYIFIAISSLCFSGCMTAFQTAQDARTLEKNNLNVTLSAGFLNAGGGIRYGITDKIDAGVYSKLNLYLPSDGIIGMQMLAADIKYNFFNREKFALATGLGYGIGSDYIREYMQGIQMAETTDAENVPPWYGHSCQEILIPFYISSYEHDNLGFFANPFAIYRFDLSDNIFIGNDSGIKSIYPGISFGFFGGKEESNFRFNLSATYIYYYANNVVLINNSGEPQPYDEQLNVYEVTAGFSYRFDLNRKK